MVDNQRVKEDETFMQQALALAEKGYGCVSPNPYVGAILVKNGHILGEGYHRQAGSAHAEIHALAAAKQRFGEQEIRGATLYVTLEPCCHVGKTGPCTQAIVCHGIARVVSAMEDPNPLVKGKGHAYLSAQGIEVVSGVCEKEARYLNRHFIHNQIDHRPYVTLKAALSLDGKLATRTGDSQWITCPAAREKSHYIRGLHDAILIGKGTLVTDNPSLTVRYGISGLDSAPLRVVLLRDFNGVDCQFALFDVGAAPTLVITTHEMFSDQAPRTLISELRSQGVRLAGVDEVTPPQVLQMLQKYDIGSVMLEGGARVYDSFLQAQCVDELALFYGPRLIGNAGAYELWPSSKITQLTTAPVLAIEQAEQVGESLYVNAFIKRKDVNVYRNY